MIEEWIKDAHHKLLHQRGVISNAYAQVEFLLGDLIVQCRSIAEYQDVPGKLPHGAHDRVKRVGILLKQSGPLDPFRSELTVLMQRFSITHDLRNLFAHGFCTFIRVEGTKKLYIEFRKFHRIRGEEQDDQLIIERLTIDELQDVADEMAATADDALRLFQRIHKQMAWSAP